MDVLLAYVLLFIRVGKVVFVISVWCVRVCVCVSGSPRRDGVGGWH